MLGGVFMSKKDKHMHLDEEGHIYYHNHKEDEDKEEHSHGHGHSHQNTKAVLNRLSKASGHLDSVKRMIQDGRDCSEVLIQLAAVISALNNAGKVILQDHIENCIVDAIESGDKKPVEELNKAISKFIK